MANQNRASVTLSAEISEHPADVQPAINENRLERLEECHCRSLLIRLASATSARLGAPVVVFGLAARH